MRGKRIVLGVTGGIAAYKAASICSQLSQQGADVRVIMTAGGDPICHQDDVSSAVPP